LSRALFRHSLVHAGRNDSFGNRLVQFLDFFPCREDIEVFTEFGAFDNAAAQVVRLFYVLDQLSSFVRCH